MVVLKSTVKKMLSRVVLYITIWAFDALCRVKSSVGRGVIKVSTIHVINLGITFFDSAKQTGLSDIWRGWRIMAKFIPSMYSVWCLLTVIIPTLPYYPFMYKRTFLILKKIPWKMSKTQNVSYRQDR